MIVTDYDGTRTKAVEMADVHSSLLAPGSSRVLMKRQTDREQRSDERGYMISVRRLGSTCQ